MPIYDYKCRDCGKTFEQLVLKNTVVECPKCQGKSLEQLISTGFAVSSGELTRSRVKAARAQYIASKERKDKAVAEMEEIKEHSEEHH